MVAQPAKSEQPDRASLYLLVVIAGLIIIGGVLQFRYYLLKSAKDLDSNYAAALQNSQGSTFQNSNEAADLQDQQTKDDDSDSLNNFQELYVTGTSPYLADTDSDGVNDSTEITAGTNPNCPTGDTCETAPQTGDGTTSEAQNQLANLAPTLTNGDLTRDEMIKTLEKQGVSADELSRATDAQIQSLYQEFVAASTEGANAIDNLENKAESIRALSITDKRKLLLESGVDSTTVDGLNDDQVDQLVEQAITSLFEAQGLNQNTNQSSTTTPANTSANSPAQ
jgi:hypothetical protein